MAAVFIKLKTQADVNQFVSLMHSYNARVAHEGNVSRVGTEAIVYPYESTRIAFAHGRKHHNWMASGGHVTVNQLATLLSKGK